MVQEVMLTHIQTHTLHTAHTHTYVHTHSDGSGSDVCTHLSPVHTYIVENVDVDTEDS